VMSLVLDVMHYQTVDYLPENVCYRQLLCCDSSYYYCCSIVIAVVVVVILLL